MIKAKKGKIRVKGSISEVMADIATIVHSVYHEVLIVRFPEEKAKEIMLDMISAGMLTHEQAAQQAATDLMELLKKVFHVDEEKDGEEE